MFTAIIPTLWKSPRITQLIADLCACEFVGEVFIVDNDVDADCPVNFSNPHPKLKIEMMDKNIFVNPSWNYGAERAKFDNLLICNDDINFNPSFLEIYDDSLQHTGIIGMDFSNYQLKADHNIHLKPMKDRPYGWGCLMLIHKSKYVPIPDDLLIANGDDWLAQHATPFVLHGLSVQSEISTTSRLEEFGMIQLRDNETYKTKYGTPRTI
jgi:hypothetical protein